VDGRQTTEALITTSADRRARQTGEFSSVTFEENRGAIDSAVRLALQPTIRRAQASMTKAT
jgi:hypothetical protein